MSFIKVYIHFVWSTKNREPFLATHAIRKQLWEHITENARKKGIYIACINGYTDHCHCLVSLGVNQTIQEVILLIKGESSFWMNQKISLDTNLSGKESILRHRFPKESFLKQNAISKDKKHITIKSLMAMKWDVLFKFSG